MKIALLSDIHSNAHALKAVLKSAKEKDVNKILCCGDYIGYYYEPERVMDLLEKWDWDGVSGNHEAMLVDWINEKNRTNIKVKYGSGISIATKRLPNDKLTLLCEMPIVKKLKISNKKILICHGSPYERDIYIYPDSEKKTIDKMFNYDSDFNLMVFGHTHYPVIWKKGNKTIINPGSVGQPRDRIPGACWVLWDTITNEFIFQREKYDVSAVIEMCKKFDPELSYLVNVLIRK